MEETDIKLSKNSKPKSVSFAEKPTLVREISYNYNDPRNFTEMASNNIPENVDPTDDSIIQITRQPTIQLPIQQSTPTSLKNKGAFHKFQKMIGIKGGKRTKRRNTKKRNTKKRNTKKRNTKRRNTKKRNTKKRK